MLPVLLDFSFIKIYTFGVFLVLALFWGAFLLWRNFLLTSYKEEEIFDGLFLSLGGGLFMSRLIYVILHFDKFGFSFLKFILINGYPGLSLYGFLGGFFAVLYIYLISKNAKFADVVDYFVPSAFVALGFGKIGAFLAGAEVGEKTHFVLSLRYVGSEGTRHLTPLYEGLLFFIAAFVSYQLLFAIRRGKFAKGFNFWFFCWCFGLVYAVFDSLKGARVWIFRTISFNAILSYILLLTFTLYFIYYFRSSIFSFFNNNGKNIFKGIRKKSSGGSKKREGKNSSSN